MNANEIKSPMGVTVEFLKKDYGGIFGPYRGKYEDVHDIYCDMKCLVYDLSENLDAANKQIAELESAKLESSSAGLRALLAEKERRIAELEAKLQPSPQPEAKLDIPTCPKCGTEMGLQTYPRDGTWWCPNIKCSHSVRTRTPTTINESQLDIVLKNIIFQAEQSRAGDFRHDSWDLDAHVEITLTISDLRHIDRIIKKPAEPQPEADDVRTYHAKGNTDWTPLCGSDERSIAHTHATVNCPSCLAKLKQSEVRPVELKPVTLESGDVLRDPKDNSVYELILQVKDGWLYRSQSSRTVLWNSNFKWAQVRVNGNWLEVSTGKPVQP